MKLNFKKAFKFDIKNKAMLWTFWGLFALLLGFHNMDIAQNGLRMADQFEIHTNLTLTETNGWGWQYPLLDVYRMGAVLVIFSGPLLFVGGYYFSMLKNPDEVIIQQKDGAQIEL